MVREGDIVMNLCLTDGCSCSILQSESKRMQPPSAVGGAGRDPGRRAHEAAGRPRGRHARALGKCPYRPLSAGVRSLWTAVWCQRRLPGGGSAWRGWVGVAVWSSLGRSVVWAACSVCGAAGGLDRLRERVWRAADPSRAGWQAGSGVEGGSRAGGGRRGPRPRVEVGSGCQ